MQLLPSSSVAGSALGVPVISPTEVSSVLNDVPIDVSPEDVESPESVDVSLISVTLEAVVSPESLGVSVVGISPVPVDTSLAGVSLVSVTSEPVASVDISVVEVISKSVGVTLVSVTPELVISLVGVSPEVVVGASPEVVGVCVP